MKILIAIPTFETIFPDTFKSIWDMNTDFNQLIFDYVRGYDCATARNNIVQRALDMDADYVLMIDNDVIVPKDILRIMLQDPVDVCLGYYAHRDVDNIYRGRTSICKLLQEDGTPYFNYPLESEYTAEEMKQLNQKGVTKVQIHGGGMGCAFIDTDVFRKLDYPWYDWVNYKDDNRGMLSEDLYFCELCRIADIQIFTDVRASCGHILRHAQYVE